MQKILKNALESNANPEQAAAIRTDGNALAHLIEGEVIPRLMVAHSVDHNGDAREIRDTQARIEPAEAARFAPLPLVADTDELMGKVQEFLDRGVHPESIFVDLLAPSAQRLGQLWETDACDFLDVTMGLWRLQEVMHETARLSPGTTKGRDNPPSILLSPMPGETHSFGSLMVEEVFARAGWRSEVLLEPQRSELLKVVAGNSYDVVGLTISCDCLSSHLTDIITAIRSVSKSPSTKVIIGGRMVNAHPELVEQCGADGTATDAISALSLAERIVLETHSRASPTA
ncbi:cobalamin B12-binding domain-containing protein [Erythrobacter sp. HA6-11]